MRDGPDVEIRKGVAADLPHVLGLIRELAAYEKAPEEVSLTLEELKEDGFGKQPAYGLHVAEMDGRIVGIALYYQKYSTWKGCCLFLEDLIVTEKARGNGIGGRLFGKVVEVAREWNSARIEWQVLDWNRPALGFYRHLGAELDSTWLNGRLTREQLRLFNQR